MKHHCKFKYGQFKVTIVLTSLNGYKVDDYRSENACHIECVGNYVATMGSYYEGAVCACYYTPEILSGKLKDIITRKCRRLMEVR